MGSIRQSPPSLKIKIAVESSQQERNCQPPIVSSQQLMVLSARRDDVPLSNESREDADGS
jgi:hypothetical protein